MQMTLLEEQAVKITAFNGIEVFRIRSGKFKTNSINFFFIDNMEEARVAKNALLPAVLRRGCRSHPTFGEIALQLESLYGAGFDCGVTKKGELQILQFYIDFLSDTYAGTAGSQFDQALNLLVEIVTEPVQENGLFRADYVAQEKENLQKLIESRVNDKMQYSMERCFEEMCSSEPYGIYEYGSVKAVGAITPEELQEHYRTVLETFPLKVFLSGEMDPAMTERAVEKLKTLARGKVKALVPAKVEKKVESEKNVVERMNVNQGKLCLGFRTKIPSSHPDYYALFVCNGILGGGIHSKLFQNVREKASLAYYAFSRLEKFKGLMLISSGIEAANRDKTLKIMLEQLEEIKKGNITEEEYQATLKTIETGVKSLRDSQNQIVDYYLSQSLAGTADSMDDIIRKVQQVQREDIVRAAAGITLDTIYFLTVQEA